MEPFELIKHILTTQCDCQVEIKESSRLIEDLELESLSLLILVTELENYYQVAIAIGEEYHFHTIGDIVQYIHTRQMAHG